MGRVTISGVTVSHGWHYAPAQFASREQIARRTTAARIAVEWPYTAAQVLLVVDAADGNETIAREALRSTSQMGYGNHLINAASAARSMRTHSAQA